MVEIDRQTGEQTVLQDFGPREADRVELPAAHRDPVMEGLQGVTIDEEGTAFEVFEGFDPGWPVAGKTGTAEVASKEDTSLFVGFGPVETPRVVATVVLEESGFGSEAAAPVVRRLLDLVAHPEMLPIHPTSTESDDPAAAYDRLWAELWNEDPDAELDADGNPIDESETDGSGDAGSER